MSSGRSCALVAVPAQPPSGSVVPVLLLLLVVKLTPPSPVLVLFVTPAPAPWPPPPAPPLLPPVKWLLLCPAEQEAPSAAESSPVLTSPKRREERAVFDMGVPRWSES